MAFTTQARLQQMSGSLGSGKDITPAAGMASAGSALAAVGASDLAAILQVFGDSIAHIHGKADFTNQTPGLISHDNSSVDVVIQQAQAGSSRKLHIDSDATGASALDIDSAGGMDVNVEGVLDIDAGDDSVIAVTTAAKDLALTVSGGGAQVLSLNSAGTGGDAIDINATAGGITVDSAGVLSMDAADDINLTLATGGGDAKDLTIASTGGGDSSVLISSAGTGADAVSIDVSAGSMVIAPSLADEKTLKLGNNASTEMIFTPSGTAGNEKISLTNTAGTASDAIAITATAGGLDLNAVQASSITVASAGDADDLTIEVTGGNDASLLLSSAGTGADAVSIDVSAGSMVIAPSLIDGKTLKLGNNASTEMIFTPSDTPANEKISLINTAGTADDAIKIDSLAGGLLLAAGNDSLHLDADGTDADALNIDSAGGMDVDVAGVLNMAAGDDSVIAVTTAAKDLALTVSGGGAQVLQLNSAGTGTDAIDINASAGGIDVDAQTAVTISSGGGGTGDLTLHAAGSTSGNVIMKPQGSQSLIIMSSSFDGIMDMGGSQGVVVYKATQFKASVNFKGSGQVIAYHSGTNPIRLGEQYTGHNRQRLDIGQFENIGGSGRSRFLISSSMPSTHELAFGGTGGNMTQDIIDLGSPTEFASFVGQSLFTSGMSIIGAFNALADGIDSNYATLYKNDVSASLAAGISFGITKAVGPDSSLSSHNEARARVYLNGQLLSSASSGGQGGDTDNTVTGGDYVVIGDASTKLRFAFALKDDDLLKVVTVGA